MIDTNALLGLGFSLLAAFTNSVSVPGGAVPQRVEDVRRYVVGTPLSPTDFYLADRRGTEFWFAFGVVQSFTSPRSYVHLQNPALVATYAGISKFDSNRVAEIAISLVNRLQRRSRGLPDCILVVEPAGFFEGKAIPIWRATWRRHGDHSLNGSASLEIDGRSGEVLSLSLWDDSFFDPEFAQAISNIVMTAQTPLQGQTEKSSFSGPRPKDTEVARAVANWTTFCRRLGIDTGSRTNLLDIDWEATGTYLNTRISRTSPVLQVRFKDGTCFESFEGRPFSHYASDSCYSGLFVRRSKEGWKQFEGEVHYNWEDVAHRFVSRLPGRLGLDSNSLTDVEASCRYKPQAPGTTGVRRVVVEWRRWPRAPARTVWLHETTILFAAEFDLGSGDLKWLNFYDTNMIAHLAGL